MRVQDIMQGGVRWCSPRATLATAGTMMAEARVRLPAGGGERPGDRRGHRPRHLSLPCAARPPPDAGRGAGGHEPPSRTAATPARRSAARWRSCACVACAGCRCSTRWASSRAWRLRRRSAARLRSRPSARLRHLAARHAAQRAAGRQLGPWCSSRSTLTTRLSARGTRRRRRASGGASLQSRGVRAGPLRDGAQDDGEHQGARGGAGRSSRATEAATVADLERLTVGLLAWAIAAATDRERLGPADRLRRRGGADLPDRHAAAAAGARRRRR